MNTPLHSPRMLFVSVFVLVGVISCTRLTVSDDSVQIVEVEQLIRMMNDTQKQPILIDVRPHEAYAEGHILRAISIPYKQLNIEAEKLDQSRPIIVYGKGWGDPLALAAAKKLILMGFTEVHEFKGGMQLWHDGGYDQMTRSANP